MSIKYLLIGNPEDREEIGHYPERGASKTTAKEADTIFKKLSESDIHAKDIRNKVDNRGKGFYYFTINSKNIFFLILGDTKLKERDAFSLMEEIQNENIPEMVDLKTGKLNLEGRQRLKEIVEDFEKNKANKIQEIQEEVEEAKSAVKVNIKNMFNNIEDLESTEKKAEELKEDANKYNDSAVKLKRITWWKKCKWWIILIAVIVLLIIIIIPVSLRKK